MFGELFDSVTCSIAEFVDDPVGKTIDTAMQPIRDGAELIDGLTEGELRVKAAARLGVDIAAGMAIDELIEWYSEE